MICEIGCNIIVINIYFFGKYYFFEKFKFLNYWERERGGGGIFKLNVVIRFYIYYKCVVGRGFNDCLGYFIFCNILEKLIYIDYFGRF